MFILCIRTWFRHTVPTVYLRSFWIRRSSLSPLANGYEVASLCIIPIKRLNECKANKRWFPTSLQSSPEWLGGSGNLSWLFLPLRKGIYQMPGCLSSCLEKYLETKVSLHLIFLQMVRKKKMDNLGLLNALSPSSLYEERLNNLGCQMPCFLYPYMKRN